MIHLKWRLEKRSECAGKAGLELLSEVVIVDSYKGPEYKHMSEV